MPVMRSCRYALMRAIQMRTSRYVSRTLRAEPLRDQPDQRQHGERDEREPPVEPDHHRHDPDQREQSPNTDTTPDVNSSLRTSTSVVTRVISRPTGIAVVERRSSRCRCS